MNSSLVSLAFLLQAIVATHGSSDTDATANPESWDWTWWSSFAASDYFIPVVVLTGVLSCASIAGCIYCCRGRCCRSALERLRIIGGRWDTPALGVSGATAPATATANVSQPKCGCNKGVALASEDKTTTTTPPVAVPMADACLGAKGVLTAPTHPKCGCSHAKGGLSQSYADRTLTACTSLDGSVELDAVV